MNLPASLTRLRAASLPILLIVTTLPTPALAEMRSPPAAAPPESAARSGPAMVGTMSAAGPVELRDVRVRREATVFAGDSIRTGTQAWASLTLGAGHRVELGDHAQVRVEPNRIDMTSGSLAFGSAGAEEAEAAMTIAVSDWRIEARNGAAGEVVLLADAVGVRAASGSVRVSGGAETVVLEAGEARVFDLAGASGPDPVPAPRRQLTDGEWLGVGIAAAATAIGFVTWQLLRDDEASTSTPD